MCIDMRMKSANLDFRFAIPHPSKLPMIEMKENGENMMYRLGNLTDNFVLAPIHAGHPAKEL